jgi:hypothetical protein
MKSILFFAIAICASINLFAQTPVLEWARQMGGGGNEKGNSLTLDASGNVYTTGSFYDTVDFDPGPGIYTLISAGETDIFISKLDASGNFVWAKKFGGTSVDVGNYIITDAAKNIYFTGYFRDTADFDPGIDTFNLASYGNGNGVDAFISKLDSNGNFIWAKRLGGTDHDRGHSILLDAQANLIITGSFKQMTDFDPGPGVFNLFGANMDIFVWKLDSSGNFIWAKRMGGNYADDGVAIASDNSGNIFTTGFFQGTADFDPDTNTIYNLVTNGTHDVFISKLDSSGNFLWAKSIGSSPYDEGFSIIADNSGNVYTGGFVVDSTDMDPGPGTFYMPHCAFILKLDAAGNFLWAKGFYPGNVKSISIDTKGDLYLAGLYEDTVDFNPGPGTYYLATGDVCDSYILKLDSSGNFLWVRGFTASMISTPHISSATSVKTDNSGNIFTTGYFANTIDCDPDTGVFNLTSVAWGDIFVVKWGQLSVSIPESILPSEFTVFPNPAEGNFTISLGEQTPVAEIIITNVLGQQVIKKEFKNTASVTMNIEEGNGMYFVKVKSPGKTGVIKILKQ